MEEILPEIYKAVGVLFMILLKDPKPILTVRFLRFALCIASLTATTAFIGYVAFLFKCWFNL